jgi:hypothetical protein
MEKEIEEIYDNLKERIIKINPEDIWFKDMEKTYYRHHGKPEIARNFYSKSRLDQNKKPFIFVYEYLFSDRAEIALNTGKDPKSIIEDPKRLIDKPSEILNRFSGFYGIIIIRPDKLGKKYSYEDIIELVKQSYLMLFM